MFFSAQMKSLTLLACLAAFSGTALADKKRLIIDTDMLNFDDDPLAIGLANIFQNWGEVELIGVFSSINSRYAPPGIDAINTYFGHPDIPVAIQKPVDNLTQWPDFPEYGDYLTGLTYNFTEDIRDGTNTPDPVSSYRYLLSISSNSSIILAVIGFFDNLYHLLHSGPDSISPLTGAELLTSKVAELVVQANDVGYSYNTDYHNATFAQYVLNWWPGNLTFASDDVGENTLIGSRITTELNVTTNPVGYALRKNIGYGETHYVWDAVAVYYAVCGLDDVFSWKYPAGGHVRLNGSAYATWENGTGKGTGLQNSIEFRVPNTTFAERLEDTLLWEPGQRVPERSWCKN
ncbi:uncharacterized protein F4822DRAFT_391297 [Hypoxylon trugodes]|uniref:uncharacterized protein n=1 Tax=Hypoxylon trugodes TaxID=326681 RepID=UPI00219BE8EE|nr:uncharacterized protein F4822DRAFT_391297 [Hypoxylon trugodes]KAI1392518.1 hypothetical protein F4822DRAFT_391297 [Hypoxylon trugodes]